MEQHPKSVLDLGCGEGWLCRELVKQGVQVTGTDISPELIRKAGETTDGKFFVASYEDISAGHFVFENRFDVIVIKCFKTIIIFFFLRVGVDVSAESSAGRLF